MPFTVHTTEVPRRVYWSCPQEGVYTYHLPQVFFCIQCEIEDLTSWTKGEMRKNMKMLLIRLQNLNKNNVKTKLKTLCV